jgi:hypothetical protein
MGVNVSAVHIEHGLHVLYRIGVLSFKVYEHQPYCSVALNCLGHNKVGHYCAVLAAGESAIDTLNVVKHVGNTLSGSGQYVVCLESLNTDCH